MADEQPPAPVVVLPADVPEAPPPPAAAAVAEENPPDAAAVAPHAEVNFSPLICFLFDSAISHVLLVFPSPFLAVLLSWTNLRLPRGFVIRLSVVAVEVFPYRLWLSVAFPFLLYSSLRFFYSVVAGKGTILFWFGCGRARNSFSRLGPRGE